MLKFHSSRSFFAGVFQKAIAISVRSRVAVKGWSLADPNRKVPPSVPPESSGRMWVTPVSTSQSWSGTGWFESGRIASVANSSRPKRPMPSQSGSPSRGDTSGAATRANSAFMASVAGWPTTSVAGAQKPLRETGAAEPKGPPPRRGREGDTGFGSASAIGSAANRLSSRLNSTGGRSATRSGGGGQAAGSAALAARAPATVTARPASARTAGDRIGTGRASPWWPLTPGRGG